MKIDGKWVSDKLGRLCEEIDCPRAEAGDCEGCPIFTAQGEITWHLPFETEYEQETK